MTSGDAMNVPASWGLAGPPSPTAVAAVATSTVALVRSRKTSGRYVASAMTVKPPMECPASTTSCTSVASSTSVRSCASVSRASGDVPRVLEAVAALVVEHDPVALFAEATRDGEPDLVAAAPAVGENDDGCVRALARQVPHGELRTVGRAHDLVVRPRDSFAPAERVSLVVVRLAVGRGEAPAGNTDGGGAGQQASDDQEPLATGATVLGAGFVRDRCLRLLHGRRA